MKKNLPLTGVVRSFVGTIVTKTDLKGAITYANDQFVAISGFDREELIGKNHNVVRHPFMPPAAFENLWDVVKMGEAWRGIVVNRCKNGDEYWVSAHVIPIRDKGTISGYMSVRTPASHAEIADAKKLYTAINAGAKAKFPKKGKKSFTAKAITLLLATAASQGLTLALPTPYSWIAAVFGGVVIPGILAYEMLSNASRVKRLHAATMEMAEGQLQAEMESGKVDEIARLSDALGEMQVQQRIFINDVANALVRLTHQSQSASQRLQSSDSLLASQVDQFSAITVAVEEIGAAIASVAASSQMVSELSSDASAKTESCEKQMASTLELSAASSKQLRDTAETIQMLEASVSRIGTMADTIHDVSEQTNLLALNAAIEAARAGEQGRGFAVVADEVRKLAERSRQSTEEITSTVQKIVEVTHSAAVAIQQADGHAEMSNSSMHNAYEVMRQVASSFKQIEVQIHSMASANAQQAQAAAEVGTEVCKANEALQAVSVELHHINSDVRGVQDAVIEVRKGTQRYE